MLELIIGLSCCALMGGSLATYLAITKKKYYDNKDQSSLSNTFYYTGWKFRVLLVAMGILLIYPILLSAGSYTDGAWIYSSAYSLLAWGKLAFAMCIGGIIGVALDADFRGTESKAHVVAAVGGAAVFALLGCLLRHQWYIPAAIWVLWLIYYTIKTLKNKESSALYYELMCFYSVPTCLAVMVLMNYLGLAR